MQVRFDEFIEQKIVVSNGENYKLAKNWKQEIEELAIRRSQAWERRKYEQESTIKARRKF